MGMCVHDYPLDRPDICAGCCQLGLALGVVTKEEALRWWGGKFKEVRPEKTAG